MENGDKKGKKENTRRKGGGGEESYNLIFLERQENSTLHNFETGGGR